jgi:hypothetical protein
MVRAAFLRDGGDANLQPTPPRVDADDARRRGSWLDVNGNQHRAVERWMEDLGEFHEVVYVRR